MVPPKGLADVSKPSLSFRGLKTRRFLAGPNRVGGGLAAPVLPHHRTWCYHPSRLVSVQTPWSLAAPRSPQFRFRLHQGRRGARSPSSIQEGRVVRPCLAAALRPSSPLDWLLAVEDSALHPSRAGRTTMASADFSGAFPHRCGWGSPDSIGTTPEISQGKLCILPSVPAGFTNAHVRMTTGPPRPWPGYPTAPALYPIPVRRVRVLPSASFRFHLTVDTLA